MEHLLHLDIRESMVSPAILEFPDSLDTPVFQDSVDVLALMVNLVSAATLVLELLALADTPASPGSLERLALADTLELELLALS